MIEDTIQKNKAFFDDDLPEGHNQRFLDKLDSSLHETKKSRLNIYLAVAASIVFLLSVSYIVLLSSNIFTPDNDLFAGMTPELYETEEYYKNEIIQKMEILSNQDAIDQDVMSDLKDIDKSFRNIKKDLRVNPGDERIISAVINTYQIKLDLLNEILDRIK